jgi:hypothetical protein
LKALAEVVRAARRVDRRLSGNNTTDDRGRAVTVTGSEGWIMAIEAADAYK